MRWYLSFHGGDGSHEWNNIHSFDQDGTPLGKVLDTKDLKHVLHLRELRGFAFGPDGDLYVANAYRNASQVLRFAGTTDDDGRHPFRDIYTEQHHTNPGLAHPFDVIFGRDGHLYVPSQDTNVVGRYFGPDAEEKEQGKPMPHPPVLADSGADLLPGTFVPSEHHLPHGVRTVRRALFGPDGVLYVADRDTNSVKRYDGTTGAFLGEFRDDVLVTPIHMIWLREGGPLLVGCKDPNTVVAIDPETGAVRPFIASGAGGLKGPAGMAIAEDGALLVCSRESKQVLRFDPETGQPDRSPFLDGLEDFPEFIAAVGD